MVTYRSLDTGYGSLLVSLDTGGHLLTPSLDLDLIRPQWDIRLLILELQENFLLLYLIILC